MEFIGLGLFALTMLSLVFAVTHLMKRAGRNSDSTHGGGMNSAIYD